MQSTYWKDGTQSRFLNGTTLSAGSARIGLFWIVLLKHSGVRVWPHIYEGEIYSPLRLFYYFDFGVSVCAVAMAILHAARINYVFGNQKILLAFCSIALGSSILVSTQGYPVIQYAFGYSEIAISVFLISKMDGSSCMVRHLLRFGMVFIVLNAFGVFVPSLSIMIGSFDGIFRGLTAHRNDLAQCSLTFVACALCAKGIVSRNVRAANIVGGIILIALAGSAQGIILLIAAMVIYMAAEYPRLSRSPFAASIWGVALAASGVLLLSPTMLDPLLTLFGRDATFTGRDRIWDLSLFLIADMPLTGYGLMNIGSDMLSPELLNQFQLGTTFGTAHNSYLEAVLSYGWILSLPFFWVVIRTSYYAAIRYFGGATQTNPLPFILIVIATAGGITSSEKLFLPGFGWLAFLVASATLDTYYPLINEERRSRQ